MHVILACMQCVCCCWRSVAWQLTTDECGWTTSSGGNRQPARIIYPTFTKAFRYDKRGRKIEEQKILEAENEVLTTAFEYDEAGNLLSQTDKAGHVTAYTYDAFNRLEQRVGCQ